jgi:hypothetical protein
VGYQGILIIVPLKAAAPCFDSPQIGAAFPLTPSFREQNTPALHFSKQHKSYKKAVNSQRLHESKGNNECCS